MADPAATLIFTPTKDNLANLSTIAEVLNLLIESTNHPEDPELPKPEDVIPRLQTLLRQNGLGHYADPLLLQHLPSLEDFRKQIQNLIIEYLPTVQPVEEPLQGPTVPVVAIDQAKKTAAIKPELQVTKFIQAQKDYYAALQPLYALENQLTTSFEQSFWAQAKLKGIAPAKSAWSEAFRQFKLATHNQIFNGSPASDPSQLIDHLLGALPTQARTAAGIAEARTALADVVTKPDHQTALEALHADSANPAISVVAATRQRLNEQVITQLTTQIRTDHARPEVHDLIQGLKLAALPSEFQVAVVNRTSSISLDQLTQTYNPPLANQIKALESALTQPIKNPELIAQSLKAIETSTHSTLRQEITNHLITHGRSYDDASVIAAQLENTVNLAALTTNTSPLSNSHYLSQIAKVSGVKLTPGETSTFQTPSFIATLVAHTDNLTPTAALQADNLQGLLQNSHLMGDCRAYLAKIGLPNASTMTSEQVFNQAFGYRYQLGTGSLEHLPPSFRFTTSQFITIVSSNSTYFPHEIQTGLTYINQSNTNFSPLTINYPQPPNLFDIYRQIHNLPDLQFNQLFRGKAPLSGGPTFAPQGFWSTLKGWGSTLLNGAGKSLNGLWSGLKSVGGKALQGLLSLGSKALAWIGSTAIPAISAFITGLGAIAAPALPVIAAVVGVVLIIVGLQLLFHTSPMGAAKSDLTIVTGAGGTGIPGAFTCDPTKESCPMPFCEGDKCAWPTTCGCVIEGPYAGTHSKNHLNAVDFMTGPAYGCPGREGVYATYTGVVRVVYFELGEGQSGGPGMYGNRVEIEVTTPDGKKFTLLYAHMIDIKVKVGQQVKPGDQIGVVDTTGMGDEHLHFEVIGLGASVATLLPPAASVIHDGCNSETDCGGGKNLCIQNAGP